MVKIAQKKLKLSGKNQPAMGENIHVLGKTQPALQECFRTAEYIFYRVG